MFEPCLLDVVSRTHSAAAKLRSAPRLSCQVTQGQVTAAVVLILAGGRGWSDHGAKRGSPGETRYGSLCSGGSCFVVCCLSLDRIEVKELARWFLV
jgi:hypothetical protein